MKLPRDVDGATLVKALARLGYRTVRQSGSHIRLHCDAPEHTVTVPAHRPLKIGTLAAILSEVSAKQAIDRDALVDRLFA